ncbi:MAG: thiamine-phosphate kinase [Candidatus Omnitrophica bacterium]|nr:thiamine-phosphate kinase [Candidatus Omnitrophota bacterium]
MNELAFIKYLTKTIKPKSDIIRGIGDDAAVIDIGRMVGNRHACSLLLASDMIVEGVHFNPDTPPFRIGWKAAAVNISDIAAMGGIPKYILVSVGIDKKRGERYLRKIIQGARAVSDRFGVQIVGGDTNASPKTVVDVSITGIVEKKCAVRRDTAVAGDMVLVTGVLGAGRDNHLTFTPRVREARFLSTRFRPSAMIDVSDGFCLDLTRICEASNVGARIYPHCLPIARKARSLRDATSWGEDFELLFTLPVREARRLLTYKGRHGYPPVTLIGEVVERRQGIRFVLKNGKTEPIKPRGYVHF